MQFCYFAHPATHYNTQQETDDIELLKRLGFEVVNPHDPSHREGYAKFGMRYFTIMTEVCDCLAFRSFQDGRLGMEVWMEIKAAVKAGKPVFELPTFVLTRPLSADETRDRIEKNLR